MIEVKSFCKTYKTLFSKTPACSDISFTARRGEITVLLGPNGAGKSTLLKALCCSHYATSGAIIITDKNGVSFDAQTQSEKAKRIIGFVSEEPLLYESLTVFEFLLEAATLRIFEEGGASVWDKSKTRFEEAALRTAKLCSLEEVLSQKISTLSHGYRQRVNFAQAIVHSPEILILDEPATGLDPSQIHEMRSLIKRLSKNMTIIFSTHILQEAELLADKILIINKGRIIADGTKEELIKKAAAANLEDAYLKLAGKE